MVATIARYFASLEAAFARASDSRPGGRRVSFRLAEKTLRFAFADDACPRVLLPALQHLAPAPDDAPASLDVRAWDERTTGEPLPPPPWSWPESDQPLRLVLPPEAGGYRLFVTPRRDALTLYDLAAGRAMVWTADASRLPTHWHGSPLLTLFHAWSRQHGLHLLHAGCVGTERGGVLLAGPGGSGKSTTALLCLQAGLRYASDDYCLLAADAEPRAHCLFSTGKLHRDHFLRFPELAARAVDPQPDEFEKKVVFAGEHFPGAIARMLPLRAVALPHVAGTTETTWRRIAPVEALRGLAPSTLFQLPAEDPAGLRAMAALVRRLPCFRLALGRRFEGIAPAIAVLLAEATGREAT
jgi:hypothetical protein